MSFDPDIDINKKGFKFDILCKDPTKNEKVEVSECYADQDWSCESYQNVLITNGI